MPEVKPNKPIPIDPKLNVPKSTVHDDVSEIGHLNPTVITGADGKQYPATKPIPVIEAPKTSKAEAPAQATQPAPAKVEAEEAKEAPRMGTI